MKETSTLPEKRLNIPNIKRAILAFYACISRSLRIARGIFPFTAMAVAALILIYYVWYWEVMPHANQVLHAAVLVWLLFAAVLLAFTILGSALAFFVTRRVNRGQTISEKNEVGGYIPSGYRVFRPWFLPFVATRCELCGEETCLIRRESARMNWAEEHFEPRGRGRIAIIRRRITVGDIFGMTEISFELRQAVDIEIAPQTASFRQIVFRTTSSGQDGFSHPSGDPRGDLVEMRRYQAGDPLRLVLWKVFARSRKLVIRTPEPTIAQQSELFVYFIAGDDDESSASLARTFLAIEGIGGGNADLSFAASGAGRLARNEAEGVSDIVDSAARRRRPCDLPDIAKTLDRARLGQTFLLVPNRLGPWIGAVREFIARFGVRPTFVVSRDSRLNAAPEKKDSLMRRILCADAAHDRDEAKETSKLYEQLRELGAVKTVDIATGALSDAPIASLPQNNDAPKAAAKGALL